MTECDCKDEMSRRAAPLSAMTGRTGLPGSGLEGESGSAPPAPPPPLTAAPRSDTARHGSRRGDATDASDEPQGVPWYSVVGGTLLMALFAMLAKSASDPNGWAKPFFDMFGSGGVPRMPADANADRSKHSALGRINQDSAPSQPELCLKKDKVNGAGSPCCCFGDSNDT